MDILNKINKLRLSRGWSIYKLAEEAELTQSTVANMFSRRTLPTISTLSSICNAFNITLSEFFSEEELSLTDEENIFLQKYRKLSGRDKKIVKDLVSSLSKN